MNERFEVIGQSIATGLGRWWSICIAIALFLGWLVILGPRLQWSDSWQLWGNTPTTWIELFQELFILAAANRVQRRQDKLAEHQTQLLEELRQHQQWEEERAQKMDEFLTVYLEHHRQAVLTETLKHVHETIIRHR